MTYHRKHKGRTKNVEFCEVWAFISFVSDQTHHCLSQVSCHLLMSEGLGALTLMCSPSWAATKSKHVFKQQLPSHGNFCAHQPTMSDLLSTNETTRPCTAQIGASPPNFWQNIRIQNLAKSQNWSPVFAITECHSFYQKLIILDCIVLFVVIML